MISKSTRLILQGYYNCDGKVMAKKQEKISPIYKHISIKRYKKQQVSEVPSLGNRDSNGFNSEKFSQIKRSESYSLCKIGENYLPPANAYSHKPIRVKKQLRLKASSEYPNYLLSSDVKIGSKLSSSSKTDTLKKICENLLSSSENLFFYKFYFNEELKTFNILPSGDSAPITECCNSNLVIQLSPEYGGKILCPQRNCFIRCLSNFFIEKEDRALLWPPAGLEKNSAKIQSNQTVNSILTGLRQKIISSKNSIFYTPSDKFSKMTSPLNKILNLKSKIF